jgi:hypothetical protein
MIPDSNNFDTTDNHKDSTSNRTLLFNILAKSRPIAQEATTTILVSDTDNGFHCTGL